MEKKQQHGVGDEEERGAAVRKTAVREKKPEVEHQRARQRL